MSDNIPTIKELVGQRAPAAEEGAPRTVEMMYRIDQPMAVDVFDWREVLKVFFPRRCHVLLVAPHHASPDYTDYSVQGADQFFSFADPLVTVKYLRDSDANRVKVENELRTMNPRLVVHYDHGSTNAVYGESAANTPQAVIDTINSDQLKFRVMSTISCLSAAGLGPNAVGKGCSSYIGYDDLHWIVTSTHNVFWNCGSMAHRMLVLGYNTQTAFDAAIATYNSNIAHFVATGDMFTATHLTMDRDRLTLVGSRSATTCDKKWILPQLKEYVRINRIPEPIWPQEVLNIMETEGLNPSDRH
jgi:hypothetical protein